MLDTKSGQLQQALPNLAFDQTGYLLNLWEIIILCLISGAFSPSYDLKADVIFSSTSDKMLAK